MTVPVLSSTTVPTLRRFSSASALLNRMPISAPLPVPTIMATGVARPNAHGQLITSTATAEVSASFMLPVSAIHAAKVTAEITNTTGTNTPATLSAMRAIDALVALASSTSWIILASDVSAPTRVARKVNEPVRLTVAALTVSPAVFSTGMDSPVSALSSTAELPLEHHAIDRDGLAGAHTQHLAGQNGIDVDGGLGAVLCHDGRGLGR